MTAESRGRSAARGSGDETEEIDQADEGGAPEGEAAAQAAPSRLRKRHRCLLRTLVPVSTVGATWLERTPEAQPEDKCGHRDAARDERQARESERLAKAVLLGRPHSDERLALNSAAFHPFSRFTLGASETRGVSHVPVRNTVGILNCHDEGPTRPHESLIGSIGGGVEGRPF